MPFARFRRMECYWKGKYYTPVLFLILFARMECGDGRGKLDVFHLSFFFFNIVYINPLFSFLFNLSSLILAVSILQKVSFFLLFFS